MSNTKTETTSGIGFFGLLALVFIALKLTNYINWSWWYVLLPIYWWIPVVIICVGIWVLFELITKKS